MRYISLGMFVFCGILFAENILEIALKQNNPSAIKKEWSKINKKIRSYHTHSQYNKGITYTISVLELLKKYSVNEQRAMEEFVDFGKTETFKYNYDIVPPLRNFCRKWIAEFYMHQGDYHNAILWAKKRESEYGYSDKYFDKFLEEKIMETLVGLEKQAKESGRSQDALRYRQAAEKYPQKWKRQRQDKQAAYEKRTKWKKYTIFAVLIILALVLTWYFFKEEEEDSPKYSWAISDAKLIEYIAGKSIKIKSDNRLFSLFFILVMLSMLGMAIFVIVIMLKYSLKNLDGNSWLWYLFLILFLEVAVIMGLISVILAFKSRQKRITVVDIVSRTMYFQIGDKIHNFSLDDIVHCSLEEEAFPKQGLHWLINARDLHHGTLTLDVILDYRKLPSRIDMWKSIFGEKLKYDKELYHMDYITFVTKNIKRMLGWQIK